LMDLLKLSILSSNISNASWDEPLRIKALHFPANGIAQGKIEKFELKYISEVFKEKAPILHQFLSDIAYTNSSCLKGPALTVPVIVN
ncbi:hypothetical protein BX616_004242, partial [Lobosporangium transversale]